MSPFANATAASPVWVATSSLREIRSVLASPTTTGALVLPSHPSETTGSPAPDLPDIDKENCGLMGPFALGVQALMGAMVLLSLLIKRQKERPKRPWKIWALDVSKQGLGQLFVHSMNVLLSALVAHHAKNNPCVLYFLNILIDTTLGVCIIWVTLRFLSYLLTDRLKLEGFVSGEYGSRSRPFMTYWLRQLVVYLLALAVMKAIVTALFALFPVLFRIGDWLLQWLGNSVHAQVIFVMMVFPLVMNVIQFWIIDSIVRFTPSNDVSKPTPQSTRDSDDPEEAHHFLGSASEDEEDDDDDDDMENAIDDGKASKGPSKGADGDLAAVGGRRKRASWHSRRGQTTASGRNEEHLYPPSQSSSPARTKAAPAGEVQAQSGAMATTKLDNGYGSMLGSPPLSPSGGSTSRLAGIQGPPSQLNLDATASELGSDSGPGRSSRARSPERPALTGVSGTDSGSGYGPGPSSATIRPYSDGLDELRKEATKSLSDVGDDDYQSGLAGEWPPSGADEGEGDGEVEGGERRVPRSSKRRGSSASAVNRGAAPVEDVSLVKVIRKPKEATPLPHLEGSLEEGGSAFAAPRTTPGEESRDDAATRTTAARKDGDHGVGP